MGGRSHPIPSHPVPSRNRRQVGLEWEDVAPILDEYATIDKARQLLSLDGIDAILGEMMGKATDPALGLKIGIALIKLKYGRYLKDQGIDVDVLSAELQKTMPAVQDIVEAVAKDPVGFGAWAAAQCPAIAPTVLTAQLAPLAEKVRWPLRCAGRCVALAAALRSRGAAAACRRLGTDAQLPCNCRVTAV